MNRMAFSIQIPTNDEAKLRWHDLLLQKPRFTAISARMSKLSRKRLRKWEKPPPSTGMRPSVQRNCQQKREPKATALNDY